jgi:hypothetical protein
MRVLVTFLLCGAAFAQASPQRKPTFSISVEPTAIAIRGDSVRIVLDVRNRPTSERDLFVFTVDAPSPAVTVEQLGPPHFWDVDMAKEYGISVATWGFIEPQITPGHASPPIAFSAVGLPGIVRYWAEPWVAPDTVDDGDVHVAAASPGPWNAAADSGVTLGIVPFPANRSRDALLERMKGLMEDACDRHWIDNGGVCTSLRVKLEHDDVGALLNELDAQRGMHVNALAYFLLVGNARALPLR